MIIPLRTDSPLRHTPYMNWGIIGANVLVFLYTLVSPSIVLPLELNPRSPQVYQFITYAFLHAGWLHIAGNMLFLYIFGNNVNDKLGNLGYLAYYLAGGVGAGILYVIVPNQIMPVIGASGAIAAVTGAYLVLFPRSNVTVLFFLYIIGQYEISGLWFIVMFFAFDVWSNFTQSDGVAHVAHIGGTLFGFCTCLTLLWVRLIPRDQFDFLAIFQRWNKRRQYRDLVTSGYNPFNYTQPAASKRPVPPDPKVVRISELRSQIAEAQGNRDLDTAARIYLELQQLAPGQVLARQSQLDIANHLASTGLYPDAAAAYELFITTYPKYEQIEQVELMLGLIYARYLSQFDRARQYLNRALTRLHSTKEIALAKSELEHLDSQGTPGTTTGM
jgi:membrane associated rhomboid family serine protease